jgi:hypothetical protein
MKPSGRHFGPARSFAFATRGHPVEARGYKNDVAARAMSATAKYVAIVAAPT